MGNNQHYSAQAQPHGMEGTVKTNENGGSLGFFQQKIGTLLLTGLCAFLYASCAKDDLENVLKKNRSRAGCNDVTCTLKFEPAYVVAERINESGHDVNVAMHLSVDGVSADEVSYVDNNGTCITNSAGDFPMPLGRSMIPGGQTYRDTFYYNFLTVDGKILQPGTAVQMQSRVQPMHFSSGLELCTDEGTTATVPNR